MLLCDSYSHNDHLTCPHPRCHPFCPGSLSSISYSRSIPSLADRKHCHRLTIVRERGGTCFEDQYYQHPLYLSIMAGRVILIVQELRLDDNGDEYMQEERRVLDEWSDGVLIPAFQVFSLTCLDPETTFKQIDCLPCSY